MNKREILQYLLEKGCGCIAIDKPSGYGKTSLLKELQRVSLRPVFVFSYREIVDEIVNAEIKCENYLLEISADNCIICIEDVDFLSGKEATQKCLAEMVRLASQKHLMIITGSNIFVKVPLLYSKCNVDMLIT